MFLERALAVTINPNIPGSSPSTTSGGWIGGFVINFYQFALLIAGILALGAIVYGGVKYAASAGNPSAQSDGKEWILAAIYGLLLLGAAYIILFTVNPNLVQLNPVNLQTISIASPTSPSGGTNACGNTCPPGTTCVNGSCATSGGTIYCGGTTNGNCPIAGQTCVNQGTSLNPSYTCVANTSFTCGGNPPNSKVGTCPPPLTCRNVNNGTTPQTAHYMCQ